MNNKNLENAVDNITAKIVEEMIFSTYTRFACFIFALCFTVLNWDAAFSLYSYFAVLYPLPVYFVSMFAVWLTWSTWNKAERKRNEEVETIRSTLIKAGKMLHQ
jgi:hypothetical protein